MLELGRFSAWVTVEGAEATEHQVETSDDGKSVQCWIVSKVGKRFSVHWKDATSEDTTGGYLYVDGTPICGYIIAGISLPAAQTCVAEGAPVTDTTHKPFFFSHIEITDDDEYADSTPPDLGLISLKLWRVRVEGTAQPSPPSLPEQVLHERSKKGVTHRVTLGQSEEREAVKYSSIQKLDTSPLATFDFKYRPLEILQASGIVPRDKKHPVPESPQQVETISDAENADDSDSAEVNELKGRLNAILEKRTAKRRCTKRVKQELGRCFAPGEVIDLTAD